MRQNYLIIVLIASLLISLSCAQPPPETPVTPPAPPTILDEIKRVVTVEAQGIILHYEGESFWSANE